MNNRTFDTMTSALRRIYICSPLRAATAEQVSANRSRAQAFEEKGIKNVKYLLGDQIEVRAFAPHAYISLMLDDRYEVERKEALKSGLGVLEMCDAIAVGGSVLSEGMRGELIHAVTRLNLPVILLGELDRALDPDTRDDLCACIAGCIHDSKGEHTAVPALTIFDLSTKEPNKIVIRCTEEANKGYIPEITVEHARERLFSWFAYNDTHFPPSRRS